MRRLLVMLLVTLAVASGVAAHACVGKTLFIGITGTPQEQLLAEMVSVLVSERTGTNVRVVIYRDARQLYGALKQGQVGLLIENTDRAYDVLGRSHEASGKVAYDSLKAEYRKSLNLVWLDSFGSSVGSLYAPVISTDVLGALPALPKLLQKLAGVATDSGYVRLLKSMKGDEKPKKFARDYLKARKLI
jgi:glycine betaine/choline ABC-type transport system substrate-binding protein